MKTLHVCFLQFGIWWKTFKAFFSQELLQGVPCSWGWRGDLWHRLHDTFSLFLHHGINFTLAQCSGSQTLVTVSTRRGARAQRDILIFQNIMLFLSRFSLQRVFLCPKLCVCYQNELCLVHFVHIQKYVTFNILIRSFIVKLSKAGICKYS